MIEAVAPSGQAPTPAWASRVAAAGVAVPVALLASLPGLVFLAGFDHLAYGLGLLAGVVLAGLLIAPHIVQSGASSITGALGRRFGHAAAVAAAVVIVLVVGPLLVAEFTVAAGLAHAVLGIGYPWAVAAALAISVVLAAAPDARWFGRLAAAGYTLLAAALLALLIAPAVNTQGIALPHVGYGQTLTDIAALEEKLLESGSIDFDTFSQHVTPFLRLPQLGFFALVFSLALGTAVLAPLVAVLSRDMRPAATRAVGAWAALLVMLVLVSVPAVAAYAKLEIYRAMTAGTPLSDVPQWLKAPLDAGFARIHGTSPYLLEAVAEAVRAGARDLASMTAALALEDSAYAQWTALSVEARQTVFAAAQSLAGDPQAASWDVYTRTVLPAVAAGAGNVDAVLTQSALVLQPTGLLIALPTLVGLPAWMTAVLLGAVIGTALVMAAALIRSLFAVAPTSNASARLLHGSGRGFALGIGIAVLAGAIALYRLADVVTIVVAALSLGASGLFPALALGLTWKRATAIGAVASIIVGAGAALYYDVGIQAFPVSFYKTWAPLSNAGAFAVEELGALEAEVEQAENEDARAAAIASLDLAARGTPGRPGPANWFGIESAHGAVFGVPLGFLALILGSVLSGRRRR